MTIRKVLVPLSGHSDGTDPENLEAPALETAFAVARKMNAHVEVFCMEAPTSPTQETLITWMPKLAADDLIDMIEAENDKRRSRARTLFEAVAEELKVPRLSEADPRTGFSTNFVEATGDVSGLLSTRGTLADLIVTACAASTSDTSVPHIVQVALRETGRPVLISPSTPSETFPRKIAVAWNGSAEAARAVALAMDFITAAEETVVIAISEDDALASDASSLSGYLDWHGIRSQSITVKGTAFSAGSLLLEHVAKEGADMLVMGAYTRDRVRRVIFGGVTGEVLKQMSVPVLMVD